MRWWGSGWQPATRAAIWLRAGALLILPYLFVLWWNADRLPRLFPSQVESFDHEVWSHGAEDFSLKRHRAFHQGIPNSSNTMANGTTPLVANRRHADALSDVPTLSA